MINKEQQRKRRGARSKSVASKSGRMRICVSRSNSHIQAQLIDDQLGKTLISVSSVSLKLSNGGNVEAALKVGEALGEKAKEIGINHVAFDRSGYLYHGRIKALAEGARKSLNF